MSKKDSDPYSDFDTVVGAAGIAMAYNEDEFEEKVSELVENRDDIQRMDHGGKEPEVKPPADYAPPEP
jgi:hypothetical protein